MFEILCGPAIFMHVSTKCRIFHFGKILIINSWIAIKSCLMSLTFSNVTDISWKIYWFYGYIQNTRQRLKDVLNIDRNSVYSLFPLIIESALNLCLLSVMKSMVILNTKIYICIYLDISQQKYQQYYCSR